MKYSFLGTSSRSYPLFRDLLTGALLVAEPGGIYEIEAVQGAGPIAVPPNDGMWNEITVSNLRERPRITSAAQAKISEAAKTVAPAAAEGTG